MKSRPFIILLGLLAFLIAATRAPAQMERPHFRSLPPDARQLVDDWLYRDCGTDEGQTLEARLTSAGNRLEPVFWEAYRLGPPPEELQRIRKAMAKRYRERQEWLRSSGEKLMNRRVRDRLFSVSESEYSEREIGHYVVRYKTAAVRGLAFVGTNASLAELERIAAQEDNPSRLAAKEAWNLIRQRGQR